MSGISGSTLWVDPTGRCRSLDGGTSLPEQATHFHPSFVQLRLGRSNSAAQNVRDFEMLQSFNIMKDKDGAISRSQFHDRFGQREPIKYREAHSNVWAINYSLRQFPVVGQSISSSASLAKDLPLPPYCQSSASKLHRLFGDEACRVLRKAANHLLPFLLL